MSGLREDMLTVISMKHSNDGWINRKEIALALDTPGLLWNPLQTEYAYQLEYAGLIESRKVGKCWEYRAKG